MTVSYSLNVSKATFGGYAKLLFHWRGSIFKALWRESLLFCTLYVLINASYRHALNTEQKAAFAEVVKFSKYFMDVIPFYFIVGFYVSTVTARWMTQFSELPWPDRTIHVIASCVHGSDERSRMIRRTLARYVALQEVLTFQTVSTAVRKRFPTTQHLVAAGIMTAEERSVYEKVNFEFGKWWIPCHWYTSLVTRAQKEGRIKDSIHLKMLFEEMFSFRNQCGAMIGFDWVGVPLAYTQVATIATYLYAAVLLVGTQSIEVTNLIGCTADYYFPFATVWRFFFSVGWLKVAEQLLNPYGEDDDDFDLNWHLDRVVKLSFDLADNYHMMHPKVKKDAFWDVTDIRLPHTFQSAKYKKNPQLGSAERLEIEEVDYMPMEELCEKDDERNVYKSQSMKKKEAGRQNSSFIRRVLNSKFARSMHKSQKNPVVGRSLSCQQGVSNPAFSMGDEDISSTRSTPSTWRKSSQDNLVKKNSVKIEPRNMVNTLQKTINPEEIETGDISSSKGNAGTSEEKGKFSGNCSPLQEVSIEMKSTERDESEDDFEDNSNEEDVDNFMPPIPEEASRANSLASIELVPITFSRDDKTRDLVTKASEKLLVYRQKASEEDRRTEKKSKGYKSCCSSNEWSDDNVDISENVDESENIAARHQNADVPPLSVCVTIEHEEHHPQTTCALQNGEPSEAKSK